MGFYDCQFSIDGKKANGEFYEKDATDAYRDKYLTFEEKFEIDWYYLQVRTAGL